MSNGKQPERRGRRIRRVAMAFAAGLPLGCSLLNASEPPASAVPPLPEIDVAIYQRALVDRANRLDAEVQRLRADLRRAEEALVLAESGLRGSHGRADAVSTLAEVRIQVERAAGMASWQADEIAEARNKLEEADRQIAAGNFGVAMFFAYRTARIAEHLEAEARAVRGRPGTLYVRVAGVNLRAGPSTDDQVIRVLVRGTPVFPEQTRDAWTLVRVASGSVGWVHGNLLTPE